MRLVYSYWDTYIRAGVENPRRAGVTLHGLPLEVNLKWKICSLWCIVHLHFGDTREKQLPIWTQHGFLCQM